MKKLLVLQKTFLSKCSNQINVIGLPYADFPGVYVRYLNDLVQDANLKCLSFGYGLCNKIMMQIFRTFHNELIQKPNEYLQI